MQKLILIVFMGFCISLAVDSKYSVYDSKGKLLRSLGDGAPMSEQVRVLKSEYKGTSFYVAPTNMSAQWNSSLVSSATEIKLQSGHSIYLEVRKGDTFSLCPEKDEYGDWDAQVPFSIDWRNCAFFQAPNVTRSIKVLYKHPDSVVVDTAWILVDQKKVNLSKFSNFKTEWTPSSNHLAKGYWKRNPISINSQFVVDRTEFTVGDAAILKELYELRLALFRTDEYPNEDPWKNPRMPFPSVDAIKFANARSRLDGLDSVYRFVPKGSFNKKMPVLWETEFAYYVVDTGASGYRLPFEYEMQVLSQGGSSSSQSFYWSNSVDSTSVSMYEWVRPSPYVKSVAQLKENPFGLYDVYGNATEDVMFTKDEGSYKKIQVFPMCAGVNDGDLNRPNRPDCALMSDIQRRVQSGRTCSTESSIYSQSPEINCKPFVAPRPYPGFRLLRQLRD